MPPLLLTLLPLPADLDFTEGCAAGTCHSVELMYPAGSSDHVQHQQRLLRHVLPLQRAGPPQQSDAAAEPPRDCRGAISAACAFEPAREQQTTSSTSSKAVLHSRQHSSR